MGGRRARKVQYCAALSVGGVVARGRGPGPISFSSSPGALQDGQAREHAAVGHRHCAAPVAAPLADEGDVHGIAAVGLAGQQLLEDVDLSRGGIAIPWPRADGTPGGTRTPWPRAVGARAPWRLPPPAPPVNYSTVHEPSGSARRIPPAPPRLVPSLPRAAPSEFEEIMGGRPLEGKAGSQGARRGRMAGKGRTVGVTIR